MVVAYRGIQQRARDAQRAQDVKTIAKALEMYYVDNGEFPPGLGTMTGYTSWSMTADASWDNLRSYLVPKYISALPVDPTSTPGSPPTSAGSYNYAYYSNTSSYCGAGVRKMYILVYRRELTQQNELVGDCTTNPLLYAVSNYRVVK